MYEYMLCWRRNDWVNKKTESKYYLYQSVNVSRLVCPCLRLVDYSFDWCPYHRLRSCSFG